MKEVIDSRLDLTEALAQNPEDPCPEEVLQSLGLMSVTHWGFDGRRHNGQIVVAQAVLPEVAAFFRHAYELKFPVAKVVPAAAPRYGWDDEKMMADNNSSGFNWRPIAGSREPSMHGKGLAFDINPRQNPYIRYSGKSREKKIVQPPHAVWRKNEPGTLHADHPLVHLMEGFGWQWGGHWTRESGRTDYQHFEKSS